MFDEYFAFCSSLHCYEFDEIQPFYNIARISFPENAKASFKQIDSTIDLCSLEPSSRQIQIANRHCETVEKTRFSLFLLARLRLTQNHTLIFSRSTDRNQTHTLTMTGSATQRTIEMLSNFNRF